MVFLIRLHYCVTPSTSRWRDPLPIRRACSRSPLSFSRPHHCNFEDPRSSPTSVTRWTSLGLRIIMELTRSFGPRLIRFCSYDYYSHPPKVFGSVKQASVLCRLSAYSAFISCNSSFFFQFCCRYTEDTRVPAALDVGRGLRRTLSSSHTSSLGLGVERGGDLPVSLHTRPFFLSVRLVAQYGIVVVIVGETIESAHSQSWRSLTVRRSAGKASLPVGGFSSKVQSGPFLAPAR